MTIRVDIHHVEVKKLDPSQELDVLFVNVAGQGTTELGPGGGTTVYVHKFQDVHLFYERRSNNRRRK